MFTSEVIGAFKLFNKCEVEYVVVGRVAVVAHGYDRTTGGLDLWVDSTLENIGKLTKALIECSFEEDQVHQAMESYKEKGHLTIMIDEKAPLDLMPVYSTHGSFSEALSKSIESIMFGLKLRGVDLDSLIDMKIRAGREQDLRDVLELKKKHNLL